MIKLVNNRMKSLTEKQLRNRLYDSNTESVRNLARQELARRTHTQTINDTLRRRITLT